MVIQLVWSCVSQMFTLNYSLSLINIPQNIELFWCYLSKC